MGKKLNKNLHEAKKNKNDEFYTRLTDIERECFNYKEHFRGKTVFLNCDDPEESMFWKYFELNFEFFGLKKLISTHFEVDKPSYKLEIIGDINDDGKFNNKDIIKTPLNQNGDFRSTEAIEILKESDIVVTNPPFSLFREFIDMIIAFDKKFLVVGNVNAITYKDIFSYIKNNQMWLGISPRNMNFVKSDGTVETINACWFTNLNHKKRNEELQLYRKYNPIDYPTYDNYDAIEVSKTKDIPMDYNGVMGVPITFLDKYNPNQFEILGMSASAGYNADVVGIPFLGERDARPLLSGKNTYARILIKNKTL